MKYLVITMDGSFCSNEMYDKCHDLDSYTQLHMCYLVLISTYPHPRPPKTILGELLTT